MARFFGEVGYGVSVETPPGSGVWGIEVTERRYQGDVIRNTRRNEPGEKVNDDISIGNSISVVADTFAVENLYMIKYVRWGGVRWTVTDVEVRSPRLILNLGSVYSGHTP